MESYKQEDPDSRRFFRCAIEGEENVAMIAIGRKQVRAVVLETSVTGYGVMIKSSNARKLKPGQVKRMNYDGTTVDVEIVRSEKQKGGYYRLGLKKIADLTPPEPIKKAGWFSFGRAGQQTSDNAAVVFGGFVLILFCAMAMPGLGDTLGTSDRIQEAFGWFLKNADSATN